jgi:hypothetical protein
MLLPQVEATPSGGVIPPIFTHRSGYWYDSWGVKRDDAESQNGYLPLLYSETVGVNRELAYSIGESFRNRYSDRNAMAEAILKYVQKWTVYGYDGDNVVMGGVHQEEWAWNADEMAHSIDQNLGVVAVGDCEDLAFLSATIYTGAGYETAIVDAVDHVALLIWLPGYSNADKYWELSDDSRGAGWIWVEATGSENPLGWTPSDFFDGDWSAYTYNNGVYEQRQPVQSDFGFGTTDDMDMILMIVFILFIVLSRILRR